VVVTVIWGTSDWKPAKSVFYEVHVTTHCHIRSLINLLLNIVSHRLMSLADGCSLDGVNTYSVQCRNYERRNHVHNVYRHISMIHVHCMWTLLWLFYIILSLSKLSKNVSEITEVIATLVIVKCNNYIWKLINTRVYIV
jgi:hypothetical protein